MATLNPRSYLRRLFPTARRLLVEADVKRWGLSEYKNVLIIGAGHDPYKSHFQNTELYTALDIKRLEGKTDVVEPDETFRKIKFIQPIDNFGNPEEWECFV